MALQLHHNQLLFKTQALTPITLTPLRRWCFRFRRRLASLPVSRSVFKGHFKTQGLTRSAPSHLTLGFV